MIYYPISALINFIASILVFIVVFLKNPKSQVNRAFGYFAFSVAFWSYCYFFWQISSDVNSAFFWCRMLMAGAVFIPTTFFHFSISFMGQFKKYFKAIIFWYTVSIFFLILDFTPLFVKDVKPRLYFQYWPTAGIAYAPFLAMFVLLTIYAHILMYKASKNFSDIKRNQMKYVFFGTAIGFLGGVTNYPLWYNIPILPIGNALVAVYVILVACAIVKYRLMDIQVVIARSAILFCVYSAVILVGAWLRYPMRPYLEALLGTKWWLVPVGGFAMLSVVAPFVYLHYQQKYDQRRLKRQRMQLSHLKEITAASIDIDHEQLLKNIPPFLVQMYRDDFETDIDFAAVYFWDKTQSAYRLISSKSKKSDLAFETNILKTDPVPGWFIEKAPYFFKQNILDPAYLEAFKYEDLDYYQSKQTDENLILAIEALKQALKKFKAVICVPCFYKDRLLAFLLMGKKQRGSYSQDEIDTFSLLAHDVASNIRSGELKDEVEQSYINTISSIIMASEERDVYIKGRSKRIVRYSVAIAAEIKDIFPFTRIVNFIDKVKRAALLHDIGNIGVPDSILLKLGKLTDNEFDKLKQHPKTALHIIGSIKGFSDDIRDGIESHHDKYDGTGYGKGVKGHRVPPIARILAVADTFDAMTSDRPYRKAMLPEAARDEILKLSSVQFDPRAVAAFDKAYIKGLLKKDMP